VSSFTRAPATRIPGRRRRHAERARPEAVVRRLYPELGSVDAGTGPALGGIENVAFEGMAWVTGVLGLSELYMTDDELIGALETIRNNMIAVATGGPRIAAVDEGYQRVFAAAAAELARRHIDNPITYGSLWDWYGRWSSGDLPNYQSRRAFVGELINPVINRVRTGRVEEVQPTGWQRVDRTVGELRDRLAAARNEEQFQAVGSWLATPSFLWRRRCTSARDIRRLTESSPVPPTPSGCSSRTLLWSWPGVHRKRLGDTPSPLLISRTPYNTGELRPFEMLHCALKPQQPS